MSNTNRSIHTDGDTFCTGYVFIGQPEDQPWPPMPTKAPVKPTAPRGAGLPPRLAAKLSPSKLIEAQGNRDWVNSLLGI